MALWRTPYTLEPWRRRGESHKTATAIWRRHNNYVSLLQLAEVPRASHAKQ